MPKIHRLSAEVASQIAAGEVIERPASVLKELLENSLDAGASRIQIESQGSGRKLLRVVDNGLGMEPGDCRIAFERHTTSKICVLEDLERLGTFGFRGEALYSVAAVSEVRLASCPQGVKMGWEVRVRGGRVLKEHEAPPISGTTVEVQDLFFNTPARAKFLKSDAVERGHLARVLEETALAHPEIGFSYKSEGRAPLRFEPIGSAGPEMFKKRALQVLGGDLGHDLLTSAETLPHLRILALLAPPETLHPSRSFQFLFVNRRPIASRLVQQAIYRAYEPFRGRNRHPVVILYLDLPADHFDANVHPAKREVRFRSERVLFEAVTGVLSSALLRAKNIPTLTRPIPLAELGEQTKGLDSPPVLGAAASLAQSPAAGSVVRDPSAPYGTAPAHPLAGLSTSTAMAPTQAGTSPPAQPSTAELPLAGAILPKSGEARRTRWYNPPFTYLGQIEATYLVFEASGGILVMDQHAAQERILFERYLAETLDGNTRSQPLMLPIPIELPASQIQLVLARAPQLKEIGFEVEPFGKRTLQVISAPQALHKAADLEEMVHRLLESLLSEREAVRDTRRHAVATIACKAAVKAHDRLGSEEAIRLLEDLKGCEDGTACPHGRPTMVSLTRDELARRFRRPGAPPL